MNKLIIKNFLSIQYAEIELKPFTILIGPQAAGKSIIAKLCYIFRSFDRILDRALWLASGQRKATTLVKEGFQQLFCEIFPVYTWEEMVFSIAYISDNFSITIKSRLNNLSVELNDEYQEIITEKSKEMLGSQDELFSSELLGISDLEEYTAKKRKSYLARRIAYRETPFFIPAGRAFFTIIDANPYFFMDKNTNIDYFLREFGKSYVAWGHPKFIARKRHMPLEYDIPLLNEKYIYDEAVQKAYLKRKDGSRIELREASSGEQEFLPLFLAIKTNVSYRYRPFIIEEPEAHLFPRTQIELVKLLVETVRGFSARDFRLLITTHSPYILSAFNNLLYAGSIAADSSKEETVIQKLNEIVPRTMQIKPNTLSAYMVEHGSALSLIHEETGLISAEAIDEASDQLSQEFNELLEL